MVEKVQEQIDPVSGNGDGIAPIGHYVEVTGVLSIVINVKAEITCESGYTIEGLQSQIENAVEEYFLSLRKKWSEEKSGIIVRRAGVENLGFQVPVASGVCVYIILMELGSIIEKIGKINPDLLPNQIRKVLGLSIKDKEEE